MPRNLEAQSQPSSQSSARLSSRYNRAELIADIRLSERQLHAGNRKRQSQQADKVPRFRR